MSQASPLARADLSAAIQDSKVAAVQPDAAPARIPADPAAGLPEQSLQAVAPARKRAEPAGNITVLKFLQCLETDGAEDDKSALPRATAAAAVPKSGEPGIVRQMRRTGLGQAIVEAGEIYLETLLRATELLEGMRTDDALSIPVLVEVLADGVSEKRPMKVVAVKNPHSQTLACLDDSAKAPRLHDVALENVYPLPDVEACELVAMAWRMQKSRSKVQSAVDAAGEACFHVPVRVAEESCAAKCISLDLRMLTVASPRRQTVLCCANGPLGVPVLPPVAPPRGWPHERTYYEVPAFFIKSRDGKSARE